MILQEFIEVNISSKNMQYYRNLGYIIPKKGSYMIKNADISYGSNILEERECDSCGKKITRKHRAWVDTFNCFGKDLCPECAEKFRQEKVKKTNLKKYGVEFPMQSKEIKEKAKQTTRENYGVDYSFQNKEVLKKKDKSIFDKYGVNNVRELKEVNEKIAKTNLEKYGSENPFGNKDIQEKIKQTISIQYGVNNVSQNKDVKEKKKETTKKHYGVEHPLQSEEIRQKFKDTCIERFGVDNPNKDEKVREKIMNTLYANGNIPTSQPQLQLFELCQKSFSDYDVELNYPLSKLALDIALISDEIKIDLEYDGAYWHQNTKKDRRRDEFVKTKGFKIIRVKSNKKLPTVEQIQKAVDSLINENRDFSLINLID